MGLATGGDLVFLHGLQERGLGLGRRPVDLIGQDHVGEDRALDETEGTPTRVRIVVQDLRSGDIRRHQIRRELDTIEG